MDKKMMIIVVIVVVILAISFYFAYSSGRLSGRNASSVDIPKGFTGDLTDAQRSKIQNLGVSLYNDMNGANLSWQTPLYDSIMALPDNELLALNNSFNFMYEVESGETFLQWLGNENFDYGMQLDALELDGKVKAIISRLIFLGAS